MADTQVTEQQQQPEVQSTLSTAPGQLTSADILGKMETGQPLYQGETLPDVPIGMSAKGFYGQFPGGASVYSQAPFRRGTYMPMSAPSTSIFDPTGGGDGTTTTPQEEAPVDTQMDSLIPDTDTEDVFHEDSDMDMDLSLPSPTIDVDFESPVNNIDLPDNLKELVDDVTNYPYVENLNKVITTGVKNLSDGIDKGVDTFHKELSDLGDELGRLVDDPIGEVAAHIKGEIDGVLEWLSDPFSAEGLDKAASQITKVVAQQMISHLFSQMGLGMAAGPAAFLVINLIGEGTQIGMPGTVYGGDGSYDPDMASPATIAGYNSYGIAVDAFGQPVHVNTGPNTGTPAWGYAFEKFSDMFNNPSKEEIQKEAAKFQALTFPPELTWGTPPEGGTTTPSASYATKEQINAYIDGPLHEYYLDARDKGVSHLDAAEMALDKSIDDLNAGTIDTATASEVSKAVNTVQAEAVQAAAQDANQGYTEPGGEADDPSGDKIICTMMNRMYGLGEYRIKQWLLYSKRHLKDEHQLGYHKLYCNLVAKMPTNRILAKILSHLADKRTDDIVAEMKGTERSWLGRFYRAILIDGPSYIVGTMIKKNWLKPADISVLQKI